MRDLLSAALRRGLTRRSLVTGVGAAAIAGVTARPAEAAPGGARQWGNGHRTRLILLGTSGGPPWWPGTTRAGTASAVSVGDRFYLVDAGHQAGRQIRDARLGDWSHDTDGPLNALRAIFLTHLHSDHTIDLDNVLIEGVSNGLQRVPEPVQVWGPGNRGALPPLFGSPPAPPVTAPDNPTPGTAEMIALMVRAFATDINDRVFDSRKPPPSALFSGHDVPIPERFLADPNGNPHPRMSPVPFYEDDRIRVSATLVQHAPVFPALAFRFDTDDGSVVFSGDTGPSDNLIELARGADILVHEVMDRAWAEQLFPQPRDTSAEARFHHLINAHTTIEQVGAIAEAAGVPTLVLNHLVPGNRPEHTWLRAQRGYSGKLVVGRDLDILGIGPLAR
ncbi:MBL fold metallo-hydrolase [Amycolatopsis orientalis]|uniref:MBL fold metallo-hydrolase n=1 Tax=Amycolatopsis orientalis TaxID=31958 RepID=UPI000399EEC3|nr:MBL fold metallo-hydrolase [Amycolatopsis orientalis]